MSTGVLESFLVGCAIGASSFFLIKQNWSNTSKNAKLRDFTIVRILSQNDGYVAILGTMKGEAEPAIVLIRTVSFDLEHYDTLISSFSCKTTHENDVYTDYAALGLSSKYKVTLISPANVAHIAKYSAQKYAMALETCDVYDKITKPFIMSTPISKHQWVYNILDGQSEQESILYQDTQFMLLPDTKWAHPRKTEQLYCLALSQDRTIRSVRDLRGKHVALLQHIQKKAVDCLQELYGISGSQIRIYVHYQPSYYHFHLHFVHVSNQFGVSAGKAILLDTILYNLSVDDEYYAKATIPFVMGEKQHGALFDAISSAGSVVNNF